jgi:hypothetical protein
MKRVVVFALVLAGCAGAPKSSSMPMAAAAPSTEAAPPKPLDHSEFSSNPNGELSEDQLQKILASPIELDLPSRVGVLPVSTSKDCARTHRSRSSPR